MMKKQYLCCAQHKYWHAALPTWGKRRLHFRCFARNSSLYSRIAFGIILRSSRTWQLVKETEETNAGKFFASRSVSVATPQPWTFFTTAWTAL
jgi:hypothetical protein